MNAVQQWAGVAALPPLFAGAVIVPTHLWAGVALIVVAVLLLAYAIAGRLREYRHDRHQIAVDQRRQRIAALEASLGLEHTTWD